MSIPTCTLKTTGAQHGIDRLYLIVKFSKPLLSPSAQTVTSIRGDAQAEPSGRATNVRQGNHYLLSNRCTANFINGFMIANVARMIPVRVEGLCDWTRFVNGRTRRKVLPARPAGCAFFFFVKFERMVDSWAAAVGTVFWSRYIGKFGFGLIWSRRWYRFQIVNESREVE